MRIGKRGGRKGRKLTKWEAVEGKEGEKRMVWVCKGGERWEDDGSYICLRKDKEGEGRDVKCSGCEEGKEEEEEEEE